MRFMGIIGGLGGCIGLLRKLGRDYEWEAERVRRIWVRNRKLY